MQKKTRPAYVGVNLSQEDYDWLASKAKEEDRTLTSMLRRIIKVSREKDAAGAR